MSAARVPAAPAMRARVIPVTLRLAADLHTPAGAFLRIAAGSEHAFLFESVERGESVGRYSFLGASPHTVLRARGGETLVRLAGGQERREARPVIDLLREHFDRHALEPDPSLPPFTGGAVGYLGYEAARWFEPAVSFRPRGHASDDAVIMLFRTVAAFDHVKQQIVVTTLVFEDESGGPGALAHAQQQAAAANVELAQRLMAPLPAAKIALLPERIGVPAALPHSEWPRAQFEDAVRAIQEHIAAGDCYQAVLSQRFRIPTPAEPFAIYRALRATNPSPYMFYLAQQGEALIGSSPEMLVRCSARRVEYSPIAGTRPRGRDAAHDVALAAELLADEKEVAEHMMLVDLGRNDLGRICSYGTVEVDALMAVEKYSHVQHLVSRIHGSLRPELSCWDALASCFPAGTVTGAPKIRAMRIIDELEPAARGPYAGAVFYAGYGGSLDSCITIRTIHLKQGTATVQAGAGIVADSVPAGEYQETLNKAQALLQALAVAEGA